MMKKMIVLSVLVLLATIPVFAQVLDFTDLDVKIGSVRVPRAFIHAGKEYNKGNYLVTLIAKDGVPYFSVSDQKKELLFEELAVLIPLGSTTKPTTVATTEKTEVPDTETALETPATEETPVTPPVLAKKAWYRVSKNMMSGSEYFRIRVLRPDSILLAYLLIKANPVAPGPEAPAFEPPKTEEVEIH